MLKLDKCIVNLSEKLSGIHFYSIEYSQYLNLPLIINQKLKKPIQKLLNTRYKNININIIFLKEKLYCNTGIIFDYRTPMYLNKLIFIKNILYNYGNDMNSLISPLKKSNIITFGDKEIGCKVDHYLPLKINFSLLPHINQFDNNTYIDIKDRNKFIHKIKQFNNFHETFNKLIYFKNGIWERANRIIPESKFYNKEILFYSSDPVDSSNIRFKKDWQVYSLLDSNDKDFFAKYI